MPIGRYLTVNIGIGLKKKLSVGL